MRPMPATNGANVRTIGMKRDSSTVEPAVAAEIAFGTLQILELEEADSAR